MSPFFHSQKIESTFDFIFRREARCETIGVESACRELFFEVVDYNERFWLKRIGPALWCLFGAEERTNNHSEAFHRSLSKTFQVAHPKLPVLINILQKVDAEMTLRYDKMRIGEYVATQSRKQTAFEKVMNAAFESYRNIVSKQCFVADDHSPEVRLLSDVSRLDMEHYHFIQQSRRQETADLVGRSKKLMDEVLNAIEKQNYYIYDETTQREETAVDGSDFVDIDAVSEIVLDKLDATQQFNSQITVDQVPIDADSVSSCRISFPSGGDDSVGGVCHNEEVRPCRGEEGGSVRHFCRRWRSTRRRCEPDCHESITIPHNNNSAQYSFNSIPASWFSTFLDLLPRRHPSPSRAFHHVPYYC